MRIPSIREKAEKGKKPQELISLAGLAKALGGVVTASEADGLVLLELAGRVIGFSPETPSAVSLGDRVVLLSRECRAIGGDLYLPVDFLARVITPILDAPAAAVTGGAPRSGIREQAAAGSAAGRGPERAAATGAGAPGGPPLVDPAAPAQPGSSDPAAMARTSAVAETRAAAAAVADRSRPVPDRGTPEPSRSAAAAPDARPQAAAAEADRSRLMAAGAISERTALATAAPATAAALQWAAAAESESRSPGGATLRAETAAASGRALTVVLDPGHGGDETGAEGKSGIAEKEITLDIARRLRALMGRDPGLQVLLTRELDRPVELDERTAFANQQRADLFVSIHVNSSPRRDARGAETYILSYKAKDEEIRTLAALENNAAGVDRDRLGAVPAALDLILWDLAQASYLQESGELAATVQSELNEALGVRDRGIKEAPFRVLMGATMPAILVEVGFLSNPDEEASLRTEEYRDRIAQALARAIEQFSASIRKRLAGSFTRTR